MTVFDRIKQMLGAKNSISSADIKRGDGVWEALTGGTGAPSEYSAMAVTAVYSCVTLISGAIASMPMHIYKRANDGDLSRDVNNALWWMLNEEFSPRWPASAGWSFMVASKLLHGDGFAEIKRGPGGQIAGLVPIHPGRVRPIAAPDGSHLVYEVQPDSTIEKPDQMQAARRVMHQDDMLHVPGFGFNGLRGLSPLRYALRSAGRLAINAQDFSENFLANMGRPDFVLKSEKTLTDDQFKRLQDMLDSKAGPINAGKPMILEGGLGLEAVTMPLEEMQLLETRKFQVEEIARVYGVPPFMIGHTEKSSSWGTGVAAMGAGFVRFALRDHLNAFQNEINRKFFRTARTVAEFDTTELERADLGVMMTASRMALGRSGEVPILTRGEIRHALRYPRELPIEAPYEVNPSGNPAPPEPTPQEPTTP